MTSEQRNYIEVLTFLQDQEVHKFPMSSFEAWVEYQCPKISLHGMTTVQITEKGRISIVGEKFDIAGIRRVGREHYCSRPPLRTVRESFPSYGSSNSKFLL